MMLFVSKSITNILLNQLLMIFLYVITCIISNVFSLKWFMTLKRWGKLRNLHLINYVKWLNGGSYESRNSSCVMYFWWLTYLWNRFSQLRTKCWPHWETSCDCIMWFTQGVYLLFVYISNIIVILKESYIKNLCI